MNHLSIDLETYSDIDITKAGLYKYVQSPNFEVMLFAFALDDHPVQIIDLKQGEQLPQWLVEYLFDPNTVKHAFNASFEWYCLSKHFGILDNPLPWLAQWRCTMVHGLYCGYPGKLANIGPAMGLPEDKKKLGMGSALIKTFCVPHEPTAKNGNRTRILPHHEPEKWQLFKKYCVGDVVTEMEVERRLSSFPVPENEWALWRLDQEINLRGIAADRQLIDSALHIDEIISARLMDEAVKLSGVNPKSVTQLKKWLEEEMDMEPDPTTENSAVFDDGNIKDLSKNTVKDLLKTTDDAKIRRMLEIRQEITKTSVRKYAAMRQAICDDGRIRGLIQFYGANRTGRWAGRIVQVHNLPQNHLKMLNLARELAKAGNIEGIKIIYGNVPDTLSQLIRTAFIPAPGHELLISDFSAIEARVIAWLAGEQWRLDVFATHGKIYEASAAQMFGVPVESIDKKNPLRQKGKIAELALGYQGGVGAIKTMGALKMGLTEEELPEIVDRWRAANKRIVALWYTIENAVVEVMRTGQPVGINKGIIIARECDSRNGQDFLTIRLPSGRKLYYVRPHLAIQDRVYTVNGSIMREPGYKESLHYWGMSQKTTKVKKWEVTPTYGGKLVENIIQAIARDCLAESLMRLSGFKIIIHVHDEAVIEVPAGADYLSQICAVMGQPISWAPGLLLKAEGFLSPYYKKED